MALINMNKSLKDFDPEVYEILQEEYNRQLDGLELIASENFVPQGVLNALSSAFANTYFDGKGCKNELNETISELEQLTTERALSVFNLDPENWGVNFKNHSGSPVNFCVLSGLLEPHDRIMGLSLQHGGHLTHGHYTASKKVNCSSYYFESFPYLTDDNGYIDYDKLEENATLFRPKLIIAGASSYSRKINFERFREICDGIKAILMVDMAHYSGLIAGDAYPSPFPYADIVTSTTHKTLGGPRSSMLFYNKERNPKYEQLLVENVSRIQRSTHYNQIAALCYQLGQVQKDEWKEYTNNVIECSRCLANELTGYGANILTNGTDSHMILVDTRPFRLSGGKVEKIFEVCNISCSRSSLPCDKMTMNSSGIRLGVQALVTRGFRQQDIKTLSKLLFDAIKLGQTISQNGGTDLKTFISLFPKYDREIQVIKDKVTNFVRGFPFPSDLHSQI